MQLTTNAKELKGAVCWASRLTQANELPEIRRCVILSAHDGNLAVQATNLAAVATEVVPADVKDADGVLAIEAKILKRYLAKVAKNDTVVEISGTFWSDGKAKVRIQPLTEKSDELPDFSKYAPDIQRGIQTDFDALRVKDAMRFMKTEDGNPVLSSMLVEAAGDGVRLVMADGFRLVAMPMDHYPPTNLGLIPSDAVKLIANLNGIGYMWFGKDKFEVKTGNRTLAGQMTEGQYPKWREIVPKHTSLTVSVETTAFRDALDMLAAMATDFPGVRMELADGEATLYSLSEDTQCEAVIPADWQGEPFDFAFMPRYMLDILPFCGDTTTIDLESPSRCLSIRGEQALCLLMPVHIKS